MDRGEKIAWHGSSFRPSRTVQWRVIIKSQTRAGYRPLQLHVLSILDFFFSSSCQLSRWFSVLPIVPVHGSPTNTHFVKVILSSARDVLFILSISGRFCTPGKVQVKSMIMGSLVQVWNQTLSLVLLHYLIKKWGKYRQWRDRLSRKVFDKIMTSLPYELCILCRANY